MEFIKVAGYLRVSSDEQREKGSIESQSEFLHKYCDLHGFEDFTEYRDDGITGTIPLEQRPAGKKLLDDAKSGKLNLLLIYKLDRLGRSARIILNAVYELEKFNVKVKSTTESFDSSDPSGRFLLTILAGAADLDRETILERMWHGANRVARTGKWMGGIVPYGYQLDKDGFLEISNEQLPGLDLTESDVVRIIYKMLNQQSSCIRIADYFNAIGVPTAYIKDNIRGKRINNVSGLWKPSRIRNMVVNTTYKGIHFYGRRTTKDRELIPRQVPAIVTEEEWDGAQIQLRENQIKALHHPIREYLLTGLVKCSVCGLNYCGMPMKRNCRPWGVILYYVCNGKNNYRGPLSGKCTSKNVPALVVDNLVWEYCLNLISDPGQDLTPGNEEKAPNFDQERDVILRARDNKENEKQAILDLYRRNVISAVDVESQLKKIADEVGALDRQIREIEKQSNKQVKSNDRLKTVDELLQEYNFNLNNISFGIKKQVVKMLIQKVLVITVATNGKLDYEIQIYPW